MNLSSLEYELAYVSLGFLAFCYAKTLKHLLVSRCTSIQFCCFSCERQPLVDEVALELVESPEVLEIRN
jgi:hypothetical protein